MTWFRLDDAGWCHAKVLGVGNRAFGAWCRAGQWASQQLSDGFVPASVCRLIEPASAVWRTLSDAGMLHPCEGGYTIHDYLEYNPSRSQVEAKQAAQREGGRAGAHARWCGSTHGSTYESTQAQPMTKKMPRARVLPDPSRPVPEEREEPPSEVATLPRPTRTAAVMVNGCDAGAVFDHWQASLMPKAKRTEKRLARVKARLQEGFTAADLRKAIDGATKDDWLMGRDPKSNGRAWKDIETVLRDAAQVERLMELAEAEPEGDGDNEWPAGKNTFVVTIDDVDPTGEPGTGAPVPAELRQLVVDFAESMRGGGHG
jgi:hypothetical protein